MNTVQIVLYKLKKYLKVLFIILSSITFVLSFMVIGKDSIYIIHWFIFVVITFIVGVIFVISKVIRDTYYLEP